ncbi:hypothetical protein AGMMS50268_10420 [Spirochaetia bacterium]|nr:hypothetical protein AGMMS50268_10420 [Spirochaetia bacterium]
MTPPARSPDDDLDALPAPVPSTLTIEGNPEAQGEILAAFAGAYPGVIGEAKRVDGDWRFTVRGRPFFYAHGRFLPEELAGDWQEYHPYDFYPYPWIGTEAERRKIQQYPVYSIGSSFLFDAIFLAADEDASWDLQEKYSFLGVKFLVHPYIRESLDRVQERLRAEATVNPEIVSWQAELLTSPADGWNWRNIAGSSRRSNHSYGTALDFLPRDLKGRLTYWRWDKGALNRENLYTPPLAVIRAFEDAGFIWGGNWDLIDTMHFEYRPEILILNIYRDVSAFCKQ